MAIFARNLHRNKGQRRMYYTLSPNLLSVSKREKDEWKIFCNNVYCVVKESTSYTTVMSKKCKWQIIKMFYHFCSIEILFGMNSNNGENNIWGKILVSRGTHSFVSFRGNVSCVGEHFKPLKRSFSTFITAVSLFLCAAVSRDVSHPFWSLKQYYFGCSKKKIATESTSRKHYSFMFSSQSASRMCEWIVVKFTIDANLNCSYRRKLV